MPSNHLIHCCTLLLVSTIFSSIRVFSKKLTLYIRWPKYWNFSISHPNEYSGLISFRIDWFDLLAVQGTLKSLLQHHSWKHQFFRTQLSLWSNSHTPFKFLVWLIPTSLPYLVLMLALSSNRLLAVEGGGLFLLFLPFLIIFFLIGGHGVLSKSNCYK